MTKDNKTDVQSKSREHPEALRVRLPGFVNDDEIGLGDVIKRATSYFGLPSCGGCNSRAEALNRWMSFSGRRR